MCKNIRLLGLAILLALPSTMALGQGSSGNGTGGANPTEAISELQTDLAALESELIAINDDLNALELSVVSADCTNDGNALQAAIDLAPAAGVIIQAEGECGVTAIIGKSNIIIDGAPGTSISGSTADTSGVAFFVNTSRNIQISGVEVIANGDGYGLLARDSGLVIKDSSFKGGIVASLALDAGSHAALINVSVIAEQATSALSVNNSSSIRSLGSNLLNNVGGRAMTITVNSSFFQHSGYLDIDGSVYAEFGGVVSITRADITAAPGNRAINITQNSTVNLQANLANQSITVSGDVGVFSSSTVSINAEFGSIDLTSSSWIVQRNSSVRNLVGAVSLNVSKLFVMQNAVLDISSRSTAFSNSPIIYLLRGGGARILRPLPGGSTVICDGTGWTSEFNCS